MFDAFLLAVDLNDQDAAPRSAQAAVSFARAQGATLHLVNVVPDDGMPIVSIELSENHAAEALSGARAGLSDWAKVHIPDSIATELHVVRGTVYDQIIRLADTLGVGGIFVGAQRPALKDYLIGPNAARVARHANQSVFVIR